jgi:TPR repeat protein
MIRDPTVAFEISRGAADASLVDLAQVDTSSMTDRDAREHFARFVDAANRGVPFAMCRCARLARLGLGTEKSDSDAFRWAKVAAEADYPPGIYELGNCEEHGIGTAKDLRRAHDLYELAAAKGFGFAAYHLARVYAQGDLGTVDIESAVRYLERSYELGESLGAFEMAEWLEKGDRLPRDPAGAVQWYRRASDMGDPFASHRLHIAYRLGDLGLPRDPDAASHFEKLSALQIGAARGSTDT